MKLQEYLYLNNISAQDFADSLGVTRQSVYNYMTKPDKANFRIPRVVVMKQIMKLTDNNVTPRDFFEQIERVIHEEFNRD